MSESDRIKLAVLIHNETLRLGGSLDDIRKTFDLLMTVCGDPRPQAVFGDVRNG